MVRESVWKAALGRMETPGAAWKLLFCIRVLAPMSLKGIFEGSVLQAWYLHDRDRVSRLLQASFVGAMAIADLVKSTLGPKGMDKILQSVGRGGQVSVTNDGATILKSIYVDNPAAKILVDISKVQDDEVGDGTTSVVVLCGELLREAERLVDQKIHPMTIVAGFREACDLARAHLESVTFDNGKNADAFRRDLMNIARTTLSSKILTQDKDHFANLAVDAVLRLRGSGDLDMIHLIKKAGGTLRDSFLDEGFILDKKIGVGQPKRVENARILVANTPMDTDKIKIYGAKVKADSILGVAEIEKAEKDKMRDKCDRIMAHGISCFINRQLIYNYPEQLFTSKGVMSIEHADFDGIERLAKVLGGDIVSTFDNPGEVKLGQCRLIEEVMIGEDKVIHFSGVAKGEACTIVLRGASTHVLDEAERSLHDALCVLVSAVKDSRVVLGGGWPEMQMARVIEDQAAKTPGKKSLAMMAFARALRQIPAIISDNAGLDSADIVAALRAAHTSDGCRMGVDVVRGEIGDMQQLGINEAFKVKLQILLSATEVREAYAPFCWPGPLSLFLSAPFLCLQAAECILRVDRIIRNRPRERG